MVDKNIKQLSLEEKIKLLTENDKLYLDGYIDRALIGCRYLPTKIKPQRTT